MNNKQKFARYLLNLQSRREFYVMENFISELGFERQEINEFIEEFKKEGLVKETVGDDLDYPKLARFTVTNYTKLKDKIKDPKVILKDVHNIYKKWFHIQDTNRIDVVLAVALSRQLTGTPLWLILVAPSGDMKTEQLMSLDDDGETTKIIHKFTDKTLVNGFPDKDKYPDLAPKLNGKVILIPDMAEILTLHPNVKSQVWGQLRNLYDGFAGTQSGMGADIQYKNIRITFIGASTPVIDDQILIHQSLGTRELIYRPKEVTNKEEMMKKVLINEESEEIMRREIKEINQAFIRQIRVERIIIGKKVEESLKLLAQYLCLMRASGSLDSHSGELRGNVHPEMPTRSLKQLKRLFICLKSLYINYTDQKALEIVEEVVKSSIDPVRQSIFELLLTKNSVTISCISNSLKIGKKKAKTELHTLWNLDLVNRDVKEYDNRNEVTVMIEELWSINKDNDFVKKVVSK